MTTAWWNKKHVTRYVGKEDEYLELCLQSWVFIWAFGACTLVDYKDKNSNSFLGYHQHWWRLKLEILWSSWQSQKFRHFFFDPEWTDGQFNNFVNFFFFFLPNWLFFLYPLPSTFFFWWLCKQITHIGSRLGRNSKIYLILPIPLVFVGCLICLSSHLDPFLSQG